MIERFNFYDVYGYFIPGVVLLLLLWTPFAIASGQRLDLGVEWAVVGLILAYVAGHLLKNLTTRAFDSRRERDGELRFPSDYLLDSTEKLTPESRERLRADVQRRFGLDLDRREHRRDVFLLCRGYLLHLGKGKYVEQFEGLYELLRGLCGAALLAVLYFGGWIAGSSLIRLPASWLLPLQGFLLLAIALFTLWLSWEKRLGVEPYWIVAALLFALGTLVTSHGSMRLDLEQCILLSLGLLGSGLVARRCYDAFRYFTEVFAMAVYRNYLVAISVGGAGGSGGGPAKQGSSPAAPSSS